MVEKNVHLKICCEDKCVSQIDGVVKFDGDNCDGCQFLIELTSTWECDGYGESDETHHCQLFDEELDSFIGIYRCDACIEALGKKG